MILEVVFFLLIAGVLAGLPALIVFYAVYVFWRDGLRGQPTDAELPTPQLPLTSERDDLRAA
jgi:hypothetical protein